jgi:hypothetical protein
VKLFEETKAVAGDMTASYGRATAISMIVKHFF